MGGVLPRKINPLDLAILVCQDLATELVECEAQLRQAQRDIRVLSDALHVALDVTHQQTLRLLGKASA